MEGEELHPMARFEGRTDVEGVVGPPRWALPLMRSVWNNKVSPFAITRNLGSSGTKFVIKKYCRVLDNVKTIDEK